MEMHLNQPLLNAQPSLKSIITLLKDNQIQLHLEDSTIYDNFLLFVDSENNIAKTDLILFSKHYGLLYFKCLDSKRTISKDIITDILDELEQNYTLIFSKLIKSKILRMNPKELSLKITPVIFCHNFTCDKNEFLDRWKDIIIITDFKDLTYGFNSINLKIPLTENIIREVMSILEGAKGIIKPKYTGTTFTKSKILEAIESEIATFDMGQKRAALWIMDGPQRIRGLAGSGKTIVLTMKAAQIHLTQPDAKIVYTYYTKALHDFIKRLITRFYRQFSERDPDWNKIKIMHAWGGKNLEGVHHYVSISNNIVPTSFGDVKGFGKNAFSRACLPLLHYELKKLFDYCIIDEGQDLPSNFYRLCRKVTKNNRVIWGYDECQNIFNINIQDTVRTFGKDKSGKSYIDFAKKSIEGQDIVLHKCYRTPRKILVAGFALGLGIYSDKIIQLPENKEHWEDFGFEVLKGNYKTGDLMEIIRPEKNSPSIKTELLETTTQSIKWKSFKKPELEIQFVIDNIKNDIEEGLLPEDILVISLDDFYVRTYFGSIKKQLKDNNIKTYNLLDAPSYTTKFSVEDHITLTTVYRAKGNEAGSVYILGVDSIYKYKHSIIDRNKLFTAITRSKAWVTITGVGKGSYLFENEMEKIIANDFKLVFKMPSLQDLKLFQRDLTKKQQVFLKAERMLEDYANEIGIDKETLIEQLSKEKAIK